MSALLQIYSICLQYEFELSLTIHFTKSELGMILVSAFFSTLKRWLKVFLWKGVWSSLSPKWILVTFLPVLFLHTPLHYASSFLQCTGINKRSIPASKVSQSLVSYFLRLNSKSQGGNGNCGVSVINTFLCLSQISLHAIPASCSVFLI